MTLSYEDIAEVLPIEDVRAHLRIETTDEDPLIEQLTAVAAEAIESDTGHLLAARAVTEHFASFDAIRLRSWPINAITGIAWFDREGTQSDFDPALARLTTARRPARLVQMVTAWPCTGDAIDSVAVTLNAGYVDAADVPHRLKQAALLMIGDLYAQRETFVNGTISSKVEMSLTVERLLRDFRIVTV